MLPDRSKRYAGVDGEIARLVLSSPWQLALIGLLVLSLLTAIFPRKALIERLYQQQTMDELTLSYVQNMHRAYPANADAALLLARSQQHTMTLAELEGLLTRFVTEGEPRQRTEAQTLLFQAYQAKLETHPAPGEKTTLTKHMLEVLQAAKSLDFSPEQTRDFANEAFALNQPELGLYFFKKLHLDEPGRVLEKYAQLSLGQGQYVAASNYYFLALEKTTQLEEMRHLFLSGVQTLMAASLFKQAMQAAQQHLGDLKNDPQTLRYLSRAALAAGDTQLAASYARLLVFQPKGKAS